MVSLACSRAFWNRSVITSYSIHYTKLYDEQLEAEIAQGKNPYADLITLSKGNDWKLQMGIGGNDAVTAKEAVEEANGDNGVPWIDGTAGGVGQPEIRLTGDIVEAGYNINLNRDPGSVAPADPDSRSYNFV